MPPPDAPLSSSISHGSGGPPFASLVGSFASNRRPVQPTSTSTPTASNTIAESTGLTAKSLSTALSHLSTSGLTSSDALSGSTNIDFINTSLITHTVTSEQTTSQASNGAAPTVADRGTTTSECDGLSCSAGIQAAIAVTIAVGILGIVALATVLRRRRIKARQTVTRAIALPGRERRWTRHLRVFSFDAEVMLGGRIPSTNSSQSGGNRHVASMSSLASSQSNVSRHTTAPPYDDITWVQPPEMLQLPRPMSVDDQSASNSRRVLEDTAPPPYSTGSRQPSYASSLDSTCVNPFSDDMAIDLEEGSPFTDSAEYSSITTSLRPNFSLNSSIHLSLHSQALTEDAETLHGGENEG